MENTNNPVMADNVIDLLKQMEGVENNAYVMRLLATVYGHITKDHPDGANNFMTTMAVVEDVRRTAWANLEEMRKLPEVEQHFLFNGEISAQEEFIKIVIDAFSKDDLDDITRPVYIQERAEAHAVEAEESVAEPLGKLRMLVEMMSALTAEDGKPINIAID